MGTKAIQSAVAMLLILVLLTGCGKNLGDEQPVPTQSPSVGQPTHLEHLTLAWQPSEGFNPYVTNSILVAQNAGLLFEKLVEIDPDMRLDLRLAQSIDSSGEQVVIRPKSGCTFADGQPITAQDVASSLQAAKASVMYGGRFADVQEIRVENDAVWITLAKPDSLFAYLCDIPVLKSGEVASTHPVASGRYTYGENQLVGNPRAAFPQDGPEVIDLVEVAGYDAMTSGLTVGSLNLYAAADGAEDVPSIVSQEHFYRTNRLVFLGANSQRSQNILIATPNGRNVLSRLISRRQLADKSFYGRAYPATGAINGFYPCAESAQVILAEQDQAGAAELLAAMGCTKDPMTGFYQDSTGQRLSAQLLVYTGNTYKRYAAGLIKEQMAAQGVDIQLVEVDDFEAYRQMIQTGEFDLYIGEVKLYNNMDITPFLPDGALSTGLAQTEGVMQSYAAFRADENAAGAFEQAFAADMPYVPLVWRNGTVISSRGVSGVVSSASNVFYSLKDLAISKTTES